MTEVNESKALASISSLSSGVGVFGTAVSNTAEEKKAVLSALMNAVPLEDALGTQIDLVNIVAQAVNITDAATGEERVAVRTVLIDANGASFATTSDAVVNSLRDIFAILGQPSEWKVPLGIIVSREKGNMAGRKFFKVTLA